MKTVELIAWIKNRQIDLWDSLEAFAARKDARGVHDMAVELQGLDVVLTKLYADHGAHG